MDSLTSFVPKTRDTDADIRYMAIADLNTFLDGCIKGEKNISSFARNTSDQKTIFSALLDRVRLENEGTVQEQVQKCYYYLCKCKDTDRDRCTAAVNDLLDLIKKEATAVDEAASNRREVASIALREALKGMYEALKAVDASIASELLAIMQDTKASPDARVKACECFAVILERNPEYIASNPTIANTLLMLLVSSTVSSLSLFRKRLVNCIVILSGQLSDETFDSFVKTLCEKLSEVASSSSTSFDIAYSLVQIVGSVAATANGFRIANKLKELLPLFVILCKEPTNDSMTDDDDYEDNNNDALDELRSLIFQSLESLVCKCAPATLLPLVQPLLDLASKFISYGSVVSDEDEEDEKMTDAPAAAAAAAGASDDAEMGDGDDDGFDDDGFDDDFAGSDFADDDFNDSTWKIRRDAVRCFVAISTALVQSPVEFVESSKVIFNSLRRRISETDESVLLEAISAVSSVIRNCSRIITNCSAAKTPSVVDAINTLISSSLDYSVKVSQKLSKILGEPKTSVKVRTSCVQLAATLIQFAEDIAKKGKGKDVNNEFFIGIWNSVKNSLSSGENAASSTASSGIPVDAAAASLKVESLHFLQAFLSAASFGLSSREHAVQSVDATVKCISDPYVHSASEALRVIPVIMSALRQKDGKVNTEDGKVTDTLALAVATKFGMLGTSSLEYEVKESSISALVSIVTIGGNVMPGSTFKDKCLPIIMGAIQLETTRIMGVKALNEIASSSIVLDISSIAGSAIDVMGKMLGDSNNKQLRQCSLATSAAIFKHETGSKSISEAQAIALMDRIYLLISSEDLYLSQLVINVAANAIACCNSAKVKKIFSDNFMEPIREFIKTQPLQGATLSSFIFCFNICGKNGVFSSPLAVVESFIKLISVGEVTKQIVTSVAAICASYINGVDDNSIKRKCVDQLISLCKKPATPENQTSQCFSMITIGQVGRSCDLSDLLNVVMEEIAKPAFEKGTDDIRSAAASMLGSVTAGNISAYMKAIGSWAKEAAENTQYYVLATLREFASRLVESSDITSYVQICPMVADMVKSLIHNEDEGKRNVAAECLGKLCAVAPTALCPMVLAMVSDASKECRTIASGAVRVMYSNVVGGKGCAAWQCENKVLITRFIFDNAKALFGLIKDSEVQVRHVTLLTINYVLHQNCYELIPADVLSVIAPCVLQETNVREELVETVKYGPHQVKQDHGLEARKAAFECLSSLLDAYPDILNLEQVMTQLGKGLGDEYDIVLLAIQICCKLASSPVCSTAILPYVDGTLLSAFKSTVFPSSSGPKKQDDEERKEDLKKKIMRVFVLLKNISGVSISAPKFNEFLNRNILSAQALSSLMKEAEESMKSSK